MMTLLTGATVDIINFIPWGFALLSILVTIYTLVKKSTKEDSTEMATVITKLELIQQAVNGTRDMVTAIQTEVKDHGNRITALEVTVKSMREDR